MWQPRTALTALSCSIVRHMINTRKANNPDIMKVLIVQILFWTVINASYSTYENATYYGSPWKSGRSKRVPFHRYTPTDTLTATIKHGNDEIHLRWERVDRYLYNENLPIYSARLDTWGPSHRMSNVMKRIGKTIIYQDTAQKSALIYFEALDAFFGVVGQSYMLQYLPFDKLFKPLMVDNIYVKELAQYGLHGENKIDEVRVLRRFEECGKKRSDASGYSSSSSESDEDSVPQRFYIETLLLVGYDIVDYFRGWNTNFDESLVMNYLLHFNAIDMLFATLPKNKFEVYINFAGIIIEEEDGVFSEILNYPPLKYNNQATLIHDDRFFNIFEQYSKHFDFPFLKDSYDLILFSTGRKMLSVKGEYDAWGSSDKDIFREKHENNQHTSVISLMVKYSDLYAEYPAVAHFIGRSLGIGKAPRRINEDKKCYSIMLHETHHCTNCLVWSREDIKQLTLFLSENSNRCFLLNVPRSLYPPGTKLRSITPCAMCTCFGYKSYAKETSNMCPMYITPENCREPLQCKYENLVGREIIEHTILPFDGIPCGENKVCWDEQCVSLLGSTAASRV